MKYAPLAILLAGCATNPGLDHRIVCALDGRAAFAETYGPLALFQLVPDADVICGQMVKSPAVTLAPPIIPPAVLVPAAPPALPASGARP